MNALSLFSGIGGIDLALSEWITTIAYCEIDTFCQNVLLSRMASGDLDNAPIWDDIKTFSGKEFEGAIDIIIAGFPCQDISIAGHGKGLEGERSGLFFEIVRLAKEIKPKFIFLENVPAISTRGGLQVVSEVNEMGYDCRWCVISASSVGALHKRERWFLLAHLTGEGAIRYAERKEKEYSLSPHRSTNCNAVCISSEQADTITESDETTEKTRRRHSGQYWPFESRKHWQKTVSEMGKCSDGVSNHVARLKALGNSVVPQQVREAFKILMGLNNCKPALDEEK